MSPNCCCCGRFTSWDSEQSTPFGGPESLEPPEPEYYCSRCARNEEDHHVIREGWVPNSWRKAPWERRAAERLGLVEVEGGKGAAWTKWVSR